MGRSLFKANILTGILNREKGRRRSVCLRFKYGDGICTDIVAIADGFCKVGKKQIVEYRVQIFIIALHQRSLCFGGDIVAAEAVVFAVVNLIEQRPAVGGQIVGAEPFIGNQGCRVACIRQMEQRIVVLL